MDQRARMFRVLTCLVLAMTGTAALLARIEPTGHTAAVVLIPELADLQAKRAIASKVPVLLGRWRRIDVAICPDLAGTRPNVLAAIPYTEPYHFVVGADGLVLTSPCWREQVSIGGAGDAVRVGVCCPRVDSRVPYSQQVALRALVAALERRCATPGGFLSVRVEEPPGAGDVESAVVQSLRTALAKEGFGG